ncbi:MAG TPA: acetate--CoA ligase [Nocardioides sp.]|uniref:acetate--CoA ligase n=1 Tax=uncultured Nocardioides sp. TaxID=198441 RepID=UPI00263362A2|nr:acetate--CoA ligase [uncultured Nocardioides sp.]HRD60188.1 acetate--CoA ligase [Nocardioides sp.]HRK45386.1 acetate--CoA ligase [Nocardioides sp.]
MTSTEETLSNLLKEDRRFEPPAELAAHANLQEEAYARAEADPDAFWAEQAERLHWATTWDQVLDWSNPPFAKWFVGGTINASYNCLDRHVDNGLGDRVAIHWVGEPEDDARDLTYAELKDEVCRAANALTELGVAKGDRVAIYMPMIPEVVVAMLACARIGAPHTVVFGGFSSDALADRIVDCGAKVVITADGGYRRGAPSALKPAVDEARGKAAEAGFTVEKVVVVKRTGQDVDWDESVDVWWDDTVGKASAEHTAEAFDSEHPLYVMYTSGSTGKPKGILHTTGGYLTGASYTHWAVFDLKADTDVYWCTADVGWVTGHSYMVYGPLSNGVTQVVYEGTPDYPERGRWWKIIEEKKVSIFYTAPTAIRSFMKQGTDVPAQHDLSTLRILGSVGEPINPEAYVWYRHVIGGDRTPVVDTWWQTETGAIMISPLPGVTDGKPGSAMIPIPGVSADVVTEEGESVPNGSGGYLVLTRPWPSMLRTIWGDDERFKDTYWSKYAEQGWYFAGDGAKKDEDGDLWVLGRVDDVMNVSGHRLSTTEIESALVSHPKVAEAAVVGAKDADTGQAVCAFVILKEEAGDGGADIVDELRKHVRKVIGPIATPRQIMIVPELPKTRSGKIMRRLLRDVAENREVGDVTTLADSSVMDLISDGLSSGSSED